MPALPHFGSGQSYLSALFADFVGLADFAAAGAETFPADFLLFAGLST